MRLLNEAEDVSLHYHHCYFIEKFVCNTATKNRMVDKVFFFKYNTQCHKTLSHLKFTLTKYTITILTSECTSNIELVVIIIQKYGLIVILLYFTTDMF